jgi:hypothetical protein
VHGVHHDCTWRALWCNEPCYIGSMSFGLGWSSCDHRSQQVSCIVTCICVASSTRHSTKDTQRYERSVLQAELSLSRGGRREGAKRASDAFNRSQNAAEFSPPTTSWHVRESAAMQRTQSPQQAAEKACPCRQASACDVIAHVMCLISTAASGLLAARL